MVDVARALELKVPPPVLALLGALANGWVSPYDRAPAAPDHLPDDSLIPRVPLPQPMNSKKGAASTSRQKPVAIGPVSA